MTVAPLLDRAIRTAASAPSQVIAASNDALINYATVQAWCTEWDLPLITTATGHFSLDDPAVVELDLLAAFT